MINFEYPDFETGKCVLRVEGCRIFFWRKDGKLTYSIKNLDNSEGCKIAPQLLNGAVETAGHMLSCEIKDCPTCQFLVRPFDLATLRDTELLLITASL